MDPFTLISTAAGGLFDLFGGNKQNKAQERAAQKQMDFQERMSNTAHQREVKDLAAAGLNPILSAKLGGASSPGGAQPNIVNTMSGMANSARNLGDKLYASKIQDAQVDNMRLENDRIAQQIEQLKISNAQQGVLTPAYIEAGKGVDAAIGGVKKLFGIDGPGDIIQGVLDAGKGVSDNSITVPSSAKAFDLSRFVGSENSEARKWAKGEKSFIQSLRDSAKANKPEAPRKKLTEEDIQAYGLRRLPSLRRP